MELSEVPIIVLQQVRHKWKRTLETMVVDWTRCALCDYVNIMYSSKNSRENCFLCPLIGPKWCTARPLSSRIHPDYMIGVIPWEDRVEEFLGYLDEEINRRRDNGTQ